MSYAPTAVPYFILTEEQKNYVLSLDAQGNLASYFQQFEEIGDSLWCIEASVLENYDDRDEDLYDFTEELWMEFQMQEFILSTMHPIGG